MQATSLYAGEAFSVYAYRCAAGPADKPFAEVHRAHSLSCVRRGSFGCRTLGEEHELVAGAVMLGRPGQEYMATHEHHGCGDECLSIMVSPEFAQAVFPQSSLSHLPPIAEVMVAGELLQAAAEGRSDVAVDEAALLFAGKVAGVTSSEKRNSPKPKEHDRRRAVEAALWLEENAAEAVGLEDAARHVALSPFRFLRIFRSVTGVTPHQYLVRLRLRRAAKLLAEGGMPVTEVALEAGFGDLSNFVRTFGRAAGVSPARFSKEPGREKLRVSFSRKEHPCSTTSD
jgi:AraC family transcriptional regulator